MPCCWWWWWWGFQLNWQRLQKVHGEGELKHKFTFHNPHLLELSEDSAPCVFSVWRLVCFWPSLPFPGVHSPALPPAAPRMGAPYKDPACDACDVEATEVLVSGGHWSEFTCNSVPMTVSYLFLLRLLVYRTGSCGLGPFLSMQAPYVCCAVRAPSWGCGRRTHSSGVSLEGLVAQPGLRGVHMCGVVWLPSAPPPTVF